MIFNMLLPLLWPPAHLIVRWCEFVMAVFGNQKLDYTARARVCVMALLSANECIMKNLLLIRNERKRNETRREMKEACVT